MKVVKGKQVSNLPPLETRMILSDNQSKKEIHTNN